MSSAYTPYASRIECDFCSSYSLENASIGEKLKGENMGKKMSNKKFIAIMAPVLVLGMALGIGATVAGNYWSQSLDTYVGRGDRVVSNPKGTEDWDTNYYNSIRRYCL